VAQLSHQFDEGFGLVDIEMIGDEGPVSERVGGDSLGNMGREIVLGAGRTNGWGDDLTGDDVQISNQGLGTMPNILEFDPGHRARFHGQGRIFTFQGLDTRHFIGTQDVLALLGQDRRCSVQVAQCHDGLVKGHRVFGIGVQPIVDPMRLQVRLILKNVPHFAVKGCPQDPAVSLLGRCLGTSTG